MLHALNAFGVHLQILQSAQEEISASGTLSLSSYANVVRLIEHDIPDSVSKKQLEEVNSLSAADKTLDIAQKIDSYFSAQLQLTREPILVKMEACAEVVNQYNMNYYLGRAVAPQTVLENILRYEKTARKNLEVAHRKLTELQTARRKTESSVQVA